MTDKNEREPEPLMFTTRVYCSNCGTEYDYAFPGTKSVSESASHYI